MLPGSAAEVSPKVLQWARRKMAAEAMNICNTRLCGPAAAGPISLWRLRIVKNLLIGLAVVFSVSACGSNEDGATTEPVGASKDATKFIRNSDFATIQKGFQIYRTNCAQCHGSEGQGARNWQQVGPDGKYPPPPLNGTGHAWHHPTPALVRTIKHGTIAIGGKMPGWSGKLTDEEIGAVIAWFQSRWPDELYQAWARMDQQSRTK